MRDRRPARMLCGQDVDESLQCDENRRSRSRCRHRRRFERPPSSRPWPLRGACRSRRSGQRHELWQCRPHRALVGHSLFLPARSRALLRYALNGQSDVRYDPFFLPKAASFLWRYWLNSAPGPLEVATRAMLPLVEACLPEHDRLVARAGAGHLIRADGWVALYKTTARFDAAVAEAGRLSPYGLAHRILTPQDFIALEPAYRPGIASIGRCHPLAGPENGDRSARPGEGLCGALRGRRWHDGAGRCRDAPRLPAAGR